MEYILYCDESGQAGPKYGDFFGGCLVSSKNLNIVVDALELKKSAHTKALYEADSGLCMDVGKE